MDKCIRISKFAQQLFPDQKVADQAGQIMQGILEARSPRLSDIAAKIPGETAACYKRIQRFLREQDPQATLKMLFNEEANFVIGDPTEIERPHANQTEYVGTLMDGQTKGFWMLTLATPLRGRAIPFHFLTYSSRTFEDQPSSRNRAKLRFAEHFKAIQEVQQLIGTRPIVFDREFSYRELLSSLVEEGVPFVIRLNMGSNTPLFYYDAEQKQRLRLLIAPINQPKIYWQVYYMGEVCLNVVGIWRYGFTEPMWIMTNMDPEAGLALYDQRMKIEIVFTQMTKMDVFARRAGRDHISDLDISIFDNYPVNEQFYQFPFLFKVRIFQPDLDTVAEILNRSCQAGELVLPIYLMDQLLFQVFHALTLAIQIGSSALVLGQRDDTVQVSFGEPIQLGLKSDLSTPQIFATGLQLLRGPVAPLRSLQSNCDDFRMLQDLTQIVPDQLIQLVGWDVSSKTTLVEMGVNHIRLSPTYIVCIARMQLARCATEAASTAAHQTPQQVFMGSVIAASNLLVVGQLGLDLLKLLQLNDSWNIRNRDPFFRGDWSMASIWPANWMGG